MSVQELRSSITRPRPSQSLQGGEAQTELQKCIGAHAQVTALTLPLLSAFPPIHTHTNTHTHTETHTHTHTHTHTRSSALFSTRAYLQGGVVLSRCVYLLLYLHYTASISARRRVPQRVPFFVCQVTAYWLCVLLHLLYLLLYLRALHDFFFCCAYLRHTTVLLAV